VRTFGRMIAAAAAALLVAGCTGPAAGAAVDRARAGQIARDYFAAAHGPRVTLTKVTETDLGITNDTACGTNWEVLMDGAGTEAGNPYHSTMYLCVDPATGRVTRGPAG
jgi:hypothetical protein